MCVRVHARVCACTRAPARTAFRLPRLFLRAAPRRHCRFDEAVASLSTVPFVATEYSIVSGVQKGAILARNPDDVAHKQTLGEHNYNEPDE